MNEPADWSRPKRLLHHAAQRRREISANLSVWSEFEIWEESCVPSYCHPNPLAAWVSWLRLFRAEALARSEGATGPVLDFGASIGELGRLIDPRRGYFFIEQDERPAEFLSKSLPHAVRTTLKDASPSGFGCIFALDSLEHNEDFEEILAQLATKLIPGGLIIISGPTENILYRLGRKIAGFDADYHVTNIQRIEASASRMLDFRRRTTVPMGLPLFRISAWSRR
jgi:SAM-dependent methyltransferase